MTTAATRERLRLADELAEAGPDADTLCEGWSTRDLAAHIVIRDRRPDAAAGLVVKALSGHTAAVQDKTAARPYDELLGLIRSGAPRWSPTRAARIDRAANTAEFFVHVEDVHRAGTDWETRQLDDDLVDDLDSALRRAAKMFARSAPAGLTLEPDGGRAAILAHDSEPMVTVRGPVGELVLWIYGRQACAQVTYDGPDDAVDALRNAAFGI